MFLLRVLCVCVVCPVCVLRVVAPGGLGGFSLGFGSPPRLGCFPFLPFEGLSFEHTRRMCPRHGASDAHSYGLRVCAEHGAPYVQHHRRHSYASSLWDKSFHILLQCQGMAPATAHLPMVRGNACSYHGAWRSFCDNKETPRAGNDSHCGAR